MTATISKIKYAIVHRMQPAIMANATIIKCRAAKVMTGITAFILSARPYGCGRCQPDASRSILGLKGGCRVWFKSWAIAAARGRRDLSTFTTLQVMKTNSDTTAKLYIGFDGLKEKTAIALAEPHGDFICEDGLLVAVGKNTLV